MRISYLVAGAATALISLPVAALAMPAHDAHQGLVTGKDVKNHSLTGKDIKNHSIGTQQLSPKVLNHLGATVGGLNISTVTHASVDPNVNDTSYDYTVSCPTGTVVVSGGGFAMLPGTSMIGTWPAATGQGWTTRVTKPADLPGAIAIQTWALCAADPA